jgi:hypothetical protein
MTRFRQALVTAFVGATLLNLWFLLGADAGYRYATLMEPLDPAAAQQFALRTEIVLVAIAALAWWASRRRTG